MKLREYRKQKELTQEQMAEQLGVRQQTISRWEKEGKTIEEVGMKDKKMSKEFKVGDIVKLKTWEELQHAPGFVGIGKVGDLKFSYNYFTREMEKALGEDRKVKIIGVREDLRLKYEIKLGGNYYRIYPEWIKQEAGMKDISTKYKIGDVVKLKTWEELKHTRGFIKEGSSLKFPYNVFTCAMEQGLLESREVRLLEEIEDKGYLGYKVQISGGYFHIFPDWIKERVEKKRGKDILISLEKFVDKNGVKKYRWIKSENIIPYGSLPESYFEDHPYFYRDDNRKTEVFVRTDKSGKWYKPGDELTEKEAKDVLESMKIAAEKLYKIREDIRKTKKEWQGKVEVRI